MSRTARGPGPVWLLFAVLLAPPAAAHADEVVVKLSFNPAQLRFGELDGYDLVSLEGADHAVEPGRPMLPRLNVKALLPPDATAIGVSAVAGGTVHLPGDFRIAPAPRPVRLSERLAPQPPEPDAATYASVLPYPREVAGLAGAGFLAGYSIADVSVFPLQFIPAAGDLILHTSIEITVTTETPGGTLAGAERGGAGGELVRETVKRAVTNPDGLAAYAAAHEATGLRVSGGEDRLEYIIICPDTLAPQFEELVAWKTRKGVPACVVTLESIYSNPAYLGRDHAEQVRNCILDHYENRGTAWVLLGGDTDLVPVRNAYDFFYDQGIPCDLYYADLDGDWNADGDGRWGEYPDDGIDMYADVFVGRAPVSDPGQAQVFVSKTLAYEGATLSVVGDFQLKVLFLAEILWDYPDPYTDGGIALDMIDEMYVPERFDPITKLYERDGTLNLAAALAELSEGYGIVSHEGHGNIEHVSIGPDDLTSADLGGLANGPRGGAWYSIGCWSAAIDHDTFGEHWLTNSEGGGVAYVGNSRYGWACPGYPGQCVSDLYNQQFFNSLLVEELMHAGLVHADAKHHYVGEAKDNDYMRYAMYELNLLGDPEIPLWTDTPVALEVTHPDAAAAGPDGIEVEVWVGAGGAALGGAVVCMMMDGGSIYQVQTTNSSGKTVFWFEPETIGEVLVTVTARDCVPYGGSVMLCGSTGAPEDGVVAATALVQNHPNPFGGSTSIGYALAREGRVTVAIYDVGGRLVVTLVDGVDRAGAHSASWDGRDASGREVGSGIYFVRMAVEEARLTNKLILMR